MKIVGRNCGHFNAKVPVEHAIGIGLAAGRLFDPTTQAFDTADHADRELVLDQRNVDRRVCSEAGIAALGDRGTAACLELEFRRIGIVGDDTDNAVERACAVKRPLRSAQHLDPRHVVGVRVWHDRRPHQGERDGIHIISNRGRSGPERSARRDTANGHFREIAGVVARLRDARHLQQSFQGSAGGLFVERLSADDRDRNRHFLYRLLALLRGDDDVVGRCLHGCRCRSDLGQRRRRTYRADARTGQRGGARGPIDLSQSLRIQVRPPEIKYVVAICHRDHPFFCSLILNLIALQFAARTVQLSGSYHRLNLGQTVNPSQFSIRRYLSSLDMCCRHRLMTPDCGFRFCESVQRDYVSLADNQ